MQLFACVFLLQFSGSHKHLYEDRIFYCVSKVHLPQLVLPYLKSSTFMKRKYLVFFQMLRKTKIEKKKKRKMTLEQTYLSIEHFSASLYKACLTLESAQCWEVQFYKMNIIPRQRNHQRWCPFHGNIISFLLEETEESDRLCKKHRLISWSHFPFKFFRCFISARK